MILHKYNNMMADIYALATPPAPCARATGWCDGVLCHGAGCVFADVDTTSDEILDAHNRAMHVPGQMAKDLLELGLIQERGGESEFAYRHADGRWEVDGDWVEAFMSDHVAWLPTEAGW